MFHFFFSACGKVISVLQSVLCRLSKRSSTIANMENGGHSRVCVIRVYQKTVPFSPSKKVGGEYAPSLEHTQGSQFITFLLLIFL
ncbi:UNVERIFIED_CONTAM: hypothetical protein NCL1_26608 [Trichonephila clavipes]